ncbi:MAG: hypothetical protein PVH69_09070, partial [Desulfobacterales bacterium]
RKYHFYAQYVDKNPTYCAISGNERWIFSPEKIGSQNVSGNQASEFSPKTVLFLQREQVTLMDFFSDFLSCRLISLIGKGFWQ